ncbi:hypothetical protein [Candidatus Accumulibacter vicinus]|uniref:Uncharacterized protein n=1 Tax=Candidatus Accumulibacter vicinus TaxID=2954382 RepID=A0A084XVK7_9PROT|nr:hypothetical protein [Candidatus Accumulibacter vicinus]KFB66501.1 MAG: hypothetical protein CAPSK01_004180 [Candidatus Accumulibacter vicinus]
MPEALLAAITSGAMRLDYRETFEGCPFLGLRAFARAILDDARDEMGALPLVEPGLFNSLSCRRIRTPANAVPTRGGCLK